MRWHVHGTDAITGHDVVLALDEPEATQAVQAAINKRILVSHVTNDSGEGVRRKLLPFMTAALVILIPLCIAVYAQNISIRAKFDQAVYEQTRLAQSVAQAETMASQLRTSTTLPSTTSEQTAAKVRELAEQLAATRQRMSLTEQQLSTAHDQMSTLEHAATQVPYLESQLADAGKSLTDSQARLASLTAESTMQARRLAELTDLATRPNPLLPKIQTLEQSNKDLATQIDLLKSQLLTAAAQSAPAPAAPEPEPQSVTPTRWALRAGYAAAADFLTLHFDKQSLTSTPSSDGALTTSASLTTSAATFHFTHDTGKERLYSATLSLPLSPNTPKENLTENLALAAQFLQSVAPSLKDPQSTLTTALTQLATTNPSQRLVLLGNDYKLTLWNTPTTTTLKIESPRADAEE